MHAETMVARIVAPCLECLHKKQAASLQQAVIGAIDGGVVSLTAIACGIKRPTALRYRVKSVDRLIGNIKVHAQRTEIYSALATSWLEQLREVLLVVDWSDLTWDQGMHFLRASVVVEGRTVTLYEEVHPQKYYGHPRVHERFLATLARILPAGCKPIVITDAGFHAAWFKQVAARGWAFVGRIRGRDMAQIEGNDQWLSPKELFTQASSVPRNLGHGMFVRSNPIRVRYVLFKGESKGRHSKNMYGKRRACRSSKEAARAAKEPWLLAVSPKLDGRSAQRVVEMYARRMQIEESFRDTKNLRVGQGLETTRSRGVTRLEMLLLIAHLAAFAARLLGEHAKLLQLERRFMSTGRTNRPEISVLTLARRLLASIDSFLARKLRAIMRRYVASPLTEQAKRACSNY